MAHRPGLVYEDSNTGVLERRDRCGEDRIFR